MNLKCLQCLSERALNDLKKQRGDIDPGTDTPEVRDAATFAPSWQSTMIGQQQVLACVAVPTCAEHLRVQEMSPLDKAILGGRLLPGSL